MQRLIQGQITQGKGAHMLARVHGLVLAGDIAPTDQIHHVGSEHLGVQTQIVLLSQLDREGVGQAADTQLDGVARRGSCPQ